MNEANYTGLIELIPDYQERLRILAELAAIHRNLSTGLALVEEKDHE